VINIYDNDNFEDECTCPNPKAHKRDCKLNFRNVGRKLFPSFKLGDSVVIHSILPARHSEEKVCTGRARASREVPRIFPK